MPKGSLGKIAIDNLSNWYYHEDMKKILLLMVLVMFVGVASAKAVDSYELFWPMVAGKTVADGFVYKLKILKENARGSLIFGATQKADYNVFLASKRLLEAEKLLLEKRDDLTLITLDKVIKHLTVSKRSSDNIRSLSIDMAKIYSEKADVAKKLQKILQFAP